MNRYGCPVAEIPPDTRGQKPPAKCGTTSGYRRHRRLGEPACDACRAAHARYYRESGYARLRYRAHRELARRHPDEFRSILASLRESA